MTQENESRATELPIYEVALWKKTRDFEELGLWLNEIAARGRGTIDHMSHAATNGEFTCMVIVEERHPRPLGTINTI